MTIPFKYVMYQHRIMKPSTKFALKNAIIPQKITARAAWNAYISEKPFLDRLKTTQMALVKLREFMLENKFTKTEQKHVAEAAKGLEFIIQVGHHSEKPKSIAIVTRMMKGVMYYRVIRAEATDAFPKRVDEANRIEPNTAFDSEFCMKARLIASASQQLAEAGDAFLDLFLKPQFG